MRRLTSQHETRCRLNALKIIPRLIALVCRLSSLSLAVQASHNLQDDALETEPEGLLRRRRRRGLENKSFLLFLLFPLPPSPPTHRVIHLNATAPESRLNQLVMRHATVQRKRPRGNFIIDHRHVLLGRHGH